MSIPFYSIFKQPRFLKERYPLPTPFVCFRPSLTPIVIDLCYLMRTKRENLMALLKKNTFLCFKLENPANQNNRRRYFNLARYFKTWGLQIH